MQKKLNGKLTLSKETLRMITPRELLDVNGGVTSDCGTSQYTNTCETCVACGTIRTNCC